MSTDREAQDYLDLIRDAHAAGRAEAEREMADRWNDIARPVTSGSPSQRELEERRWGPGGREHFGDARPGDHEGGPVKWAEPERPATSHRVPSPRQNVEHEKEAAEHEREPGA